ncbi:MAG: hypothetical protein ACREJD_05830 [Phycisphaerales bacterium]
MGQINSRLGPLLQSLAGEGCFVEGLKDAKGMPINMVRNRPWRYRHRKTFAAAVAAGSTFTFFDESQNNMVTNLPQAGQLPEGYVFRVRAVRFRVIAGIDITGAAVAAGALSAGAGAAAVQSPVPLQEQLRIIHENGNVLFKVKDVDQVNDFGLCNFPAGSGTDGFGSVDGGGAATLSQAISAFSNGTPLQGNYFDLSPGVLILPSTAYQLSVNFKPALTLTGGGVIEACLEGRLYTTA